MHDYIGGTKVVLALKEEEVKKDTPRQTEKPKPEQQKRKQKPMPAPQKKTEKKRLPKKNGKK